MAIEEERGEHNNADGDDILLQQLHSSNPLSSSWYKRLRLRGSDNKDRAKSRSHDDDDDDDDDDDGYPEDVTGTRKTNMGERRSIHEAVHFEDDIGTIDPDDLADGTTVSTDKSADT